MTTEMHTTITDPITGDKVNIFSEAKVPTQLSDKEIDQTLAEASRELGKEKGKLNAQGKTIVEDTQALIDTTRRNKLFQKLFVFARKIEGQAETGSVPSGELISAGRTLVDRATGMASSLQTDAQDVAGYIRAEVYNYLTSADYRELAAELYAIVKEMAAVVDDEIQVALDEAELDSRRKSQPSQPAWYRPLDLPSEFTRDIEKLNQLGTSYSKLQESQQGAKKSLLRAEEVKAGEGHELQPESRDVKIGQKERSDAWKAKHKELEDQALDDIQERLNRFLSRLASKKEYQSLVLNFFNYSDQVYELVEDVIEDTKQTPEAKQLRELEDQSYEILADFAGKENVGKYCHDLKGLLNKIKGDTELKKWKESLRDYILTALKNPEVDDLEKHVEKMKDLVREGRRVLQKYRDCINALYDDQIKIAQAIRDDPVLQDFNQKLKNLGSHLALNAKGEVDPVKIQESVLQITTLLANMFRDYLTTLPLTRVEIESDDYDVVMSDIKVRGSGFAPDLMEISTKSHSILNLSGKQRIPTQSALLVSFRVSNICPSFEDFDFSFDKKSFPTFQDQGRATITCDDDGLSISASVMIRSQGLLPPKAELRSLRVAVGYLNIKTSHETQHSVLTRVLAPLFSESIRHRMETLIWNQLRARFDDALIHVNEFFLSNPIQKLTEQMATTIQSNLPSV
jgi:hypothetical protein